MPKAKLTLNDITEYLSHISIDCAAVCVYLVCLPFTIVETPVGSLLKVISMPIIAVLFYKLLFGKCKYLSFNSVHLFYSLYILYTIGGLFLLSNEKAMTLTKDMVLAYITVILMTMRVYNNKEKKLIESAWLVLGVLCVYLGLFSTQQIVEGTSREFVVIGNNHEDPNQFCAYFLVPITICVKRLLDKSALKPFYACLIVLMLYAVLKGGSRGGMIALAGAAGSYILIGVKELKKKLTIIITGVLCILITVTVVFPLLPDDVRERYSVQSVIDDGGSGRFDIWVYLVQHTAEKPERIIRGSGIMSTAETLHNSRVNDIAIGAHNQFVQVFADQGVIGLLIFLSWSAVCFFRCVKSQPEYACAFVGIMALAFSLTFYSFKPLTNVIIMCAITFCDNCNIPSVCTVKINKKKQRGLNPPLTN